MALITLKLEPSPTFRHTIRVPVPGGDHAEVEFEFIYKDVDEMTAWLNNRDGDQSFPVAIQQIAKGWSFSEPFGQKTLEVLCKKYHAFGRAVVQGYIAEVTQARLGN